VGQYRIAVVSDIHGNRWALEEVLKDIRQKGIQKIVNLGDSLYGPLDPAGTAAILKEIDVVSVQGNEDRIIFEEGPGAEISPTLDYVRDELSQPDLDWLETMEMTAVVDGDLFLCHGTPRKDDEYLLHDILDSGVVLKRFEELMNRTASVAQDVILCGHDHLPNCVSLPNGKMIVNPGSVGLQAYEDDTPFPHGIATGSPLASYCLLARDQNGWLVTHHKIFYDWEAASRRALENDRSDWARWLTTGWKE
jgi:putative phosphoesterase